MNVFFIEFKLKRLQHTRNYFSADLCIQIPDHYLVSQSCAAVTGSLLLSRFKEMSLIEITAIDEILNDQNEKRKRFFFQKYGENFNGLFHGSSSYCISKIETAGFMLPEEPKMLGKGCYFASDVAKCLPYCKGSNTCLFCLVFLGNIKEVTKPDLNINHKNLKEHEYDSVVARAGIFKTGKNVLNYDEYTIYNPSQAVPIFKIRFREWVTH